MDLKIPDKEASTKSKRVITEYEGSRYQLVPLGMHRRNVAERGKLTFKAHFMATLARTCAQFPNVLGDQILEQAELTLNLMCQATADPRKSA